LKRHRGRQTFVYNIKNNIWLKTLCVSVQLQLNTERHNWSDANIVVIAVKSGEFLIIDIFDNWIAFILDLQHKIHETTFHSLET
jgi:hypothetical protein